MAGASADSQCFWQIGINVNKEFEGRNLASQHVAAKAGFEVAWVELITEKYDDIKY